MSERVPLTFLNGWSRKKQQPYVNVTITFCLEPCAVDKMLKSNYDIIIIVIKTCPTLANPLLVEVIN